MSLPIDDDLFLSELNKKIEEARKEAQREIQQVRAEIDEAVSVRQRSGIRNGEGLLGVNSVLAD